MEADGHRASAQGRLNARPGIPGRVLEAGLHELGVAASRDALVSVPEGLGEGPVPVVVLFHGASGNARQALGILAPVAERRGVALMAVSSRGPTWDVLVDGFGPDVEVVDAALAAMFEAVAVDPDRLAIGGFSDGASYALSLGLTNGDLFSSVLALSPGFVAPASRRGSPPIFVAHGTGDRVLPVDLCGRRIAASLTATGYDVTYREFDGGHSVPPEVAEEAVAWYLGGRPEDGSGPR